MAALTGAVLSGTVRGATGSGLPPILQRTTFDMSRAAEYFSVPELQTLTGQPRHRFVSVVVKELLDNAIDACETAGVAPVLHVRWVPDPSTGLAHLTITDNGAGIPREIVHRLFNFASRTSDKAVYRSPTRGAQGNALKTVLGIPWALGVRAPLVIDAQGRHHVLTARVDPAGQVHIDHQDTASVRQPGTRASLTVPTTGQDCHVHTWGRAFAVFNPHVSVKICQDAPEQLACLPPQEGGEDFYQSTIAFPGEWRKYLPTDLTSAWWYSAEDLTRLVFSHIGASKQPKGTDLLLRDFVKQFRNLSANAKAQAVCAALPGLTHLSDFDTREAAVHTLHAQMRQVGKAPSPEVLGAVGAAHFRQAFERWYGVKRFWYETRKGTHEGVPCVVEVAIAETVEGGDLWTGINFSPTFETPCAQTVFRFDKFEAHGLTGALARLGALPRQAGAPQIAVAVHIVCPTLEFTDKGKTRLLVPGWMADLLAKGLWGAGKTCYQEAEQRQKDAAKANRQADAREREAARQSPPMTMKEAVFAVLPEAWQMATGDGEYEVSARWLYYPVRKLIQSLTDKPLDFGYFSQDLVIEYQRTGGTLPGLYYDPRGVLYEPHTGRAIPLGTKSVESYVFPSWLYDKILYVEKKGVWPILQGAQLAERYDMAVVAGEGYATEAIRVLFEQASTQHDYQIFVLHDADPDGYNIARTLREETERMPGYAVDVIDLGLRWQDAMALGLDTETFSRRRALPDGLQPRLTAAEQRAFVGRPHYRPSDGKIDSWSCERVELNAFTAPALVAYIEDRLEDVGVRGKIVPPEDHLQERAEALYRAAVAEQVQDAIEALLPIDTITEQLQDTFTDAAPLDEAETWITEAFTRDAAVWWQDAVRPKIEGLVREQRAAITDAVRVALIEAIEDGALTEPEG